MQPHFTRRIPYPNTWELCYAAADFVTIVTEHVLHRFGLCAALSLVMGGPVCDGHNAALRRLVRP
jgi:hypothetical protein